MPNSMNFHSRKWVKPEDLNANHSLFGGSLLRWIDEEAAIYAIIQLGNERTVTKYMSEINFVSSARQGDIIEMGLSVVRWGRTSLTLKAVVRNVFTGEVIISIDKIVMVALDDDGNPKPHGYSTVSYNRDRVPHRLVTRRASDAQLRATMDEDAFAAPDEAFRVEPRPA
ncbi:acyl-CoA thioesterase [Luteococcus sediminum]